MYFLLMLQRMLDEVSGSFAVVDVSTLMLMTQSYPAYKNQFQLSQILSRYDTIQ